MTQPQYGEFYREMQERNPSQRSVWREYPNENMQLRGVQSFLVAVKNYSGAVET